MPYLSKTLQDSFQELTEQIRAHPATNGGQLNFLITTLVVEYLDNAGVNYENINTAVGALECAKLELTNRVTTPYEGRKLCTLIKESGITQDPYYGVGQ